jgi:hypothetical protein
MQRRDCTRIIVAFAILAIAWLVAGFLILHQQREIEDNLDRLERLAINVTASLCLQAFAPEPQERDSSGASSPPADPVS